MAQTAAPGRVIHHVRFYSPPGRPLALIRPGDAGFDRDMEAYFPQYAAEPNYQALRPYLVILQNNTNRTARAYDLRWQAQRANGAARYWSDQQIVSPLEMVWSEHPRTAIPPDGMRLVAPFFDGGMTSDGWSNPAVFAALRPGAPGVPAGPFASVTSVLNCVIWGNGSSWGPCRSRTEAMPPMSCGRFWSGGGGISSSRWWTSWRR